MAALGTAARRRSTGGFRVSKPFRWGLVVGKFCPLHHGHELLIDPALKQCDALLLISDTRPTFEHGGANSRERWLAERYAQAWRLVLDEERVAALAPVGPGHAAPRR